MKLLENGRIHTISQGTFTGSVLIEDGKIGKVGKDVETTTEAEKIDLGGKTVIPGLIDAHCHVGIDEEGERWEGDDTNELYDPITPHIRAIDGINPFDLGLQDAVKAGITTVNVGPGSGNPIGGRFASIKTEGSCIIDKMIVKEPTGIKMALGENPKKVYGDQEKVPSTRTGTAGLIRKTLFDAENYLKRLEDEGDDIERDFKLESLRVLLEKRTKARIHAHRTDDIMTAIRISEEFDLDPVIEHCTEGHKIADYLAERRIPAVVGPGLSSRSKREVRERTFRTAGVLARRGVEVAIMTDSPVVPIQYLTLLAAYSVKEGMEKEEALRAITITPAKICGIDDRVGSIEEGKDADLVILDGDPLDLKSKVEKVFIDGKDIDLSDLPRTGEVRTY